MDCRNRKQMDQLYRSTGRAALSKALHIVRREDVAREITQETYLNLWKRQIQFEHEKAAYKWIYRSVHNAAIDYLRSAAVRQEQGTEADPEYSEPVEEAPLERQVANREVVLKLLSNLDAREAEVLGYQHLDGMTQEEIAEVMGVSRKTVQRTLKAMEPKLELLRKEKADEF